MEKQKDRFQTGVRNVLTAAAAVVAVASSLGAGGCAPAPGAAVAKPANVILISLDTMRRDQIGAYRHRGQSYTPALDEFALESVVFDNAFVHIPFTLPSHLSIFTGVYPGVHGVEDNGQILNEQLPTLTEILQGEGFETLGFAGNVWMKGEFGFARGFHLYELLPFDLTFSDRVNRRALETLDQRPDPERPLFLFLHYFDAHSDFSNTGTNTLPYFAPEAYLRPIGVSPEDDSFCTDDGRCASDYLIAANAGDVLIDPLQHERLRAMYRSGVEYLDADLGRIFAELRARGLWEDSLVIVTSDHGEEFREHGQYIHNQPYVEDMAMPLLIKLPGAAMAGARRARLAQSIDLVPTILDLLGIDIPDHVQGRSLVPVIVDDLPVNEFVLGRSKLATSRFSVRTQQWTFIYDRDSGNSQLFDRVRDPDELFDVVAQHPAEAGILREFLETAVRENREVVETLAVAAEQVPDFITDEEREKLRAIGYVDD